MEISNMQRGYYCTEHLCGVPGCNGEIMEGMKMCKEHICSEPDCKNIVFCGRAMNYPKFCDIHMCQYVEHPSEMRCDERILDGKKYCSEHKCCICDTHVKQFRAKGCELHTCHYSSHRDATEEISCCHDSCDRVVYVESIQQDMPTPSIVSEFCVNHRCFGCGKEKNYWCPSCGPDCTNETYAYMFRVCKLFEKRECEVFLDGGKIYAKWYFTDEKNFHVMNVLGREIYVCENMTICEVPDCGNPALFSSKCKSHIKDENK
jgi:hypothetical protein